VEDSKHPFSPTPIFLGFALSGLYAAASSATVWSGCAPDIKKYITAYFVDFNSAISSGLVFATAIAVFRTQDRVPSVIESAFSETLLKKTSYYQHRKDFYSLWKTIRFLVGFTVLSWIIFFYAGFPLDANSRALLIMAGVLQYGAGVYVGRKIFHIAHMILAIQDVPVTASTFTQDKLAAISPYVNYISMLTAVAVYVGVVSYYRAPFRYDSFVGEAVHPFMLLPAVISVPVLIFAYYPRFVIRRLYKKAVDSIISGFARQAKSEAISKFEADARMLELRKTLDDDLNMRLRTTLEDLPMVVVLGLALLSIFKG
jgi:hypothetical protein